MYRNGSLLMMSLSQAETQEQREAEQLQRRAAKMQAARRAAIKTLQQRREDMRQQAERVAQEEIVSTLQHWLHSQASSTV